MNNEEMDIYIKRKIKDSYIPEKIDNLFNNSTKIIESKGEKQMEENLKVNQNQEQNQNNQNKPEKKKMPVALKRVLATAACLTLLLGGGNIYASTQGYDNIFFLIAEKLGIAADVFGKENILSDRDITISYRPIEVAKGTQIQVNNLVIKDNEAKLKILVNESNAVEGITSLKYVVKDEKGTKLYSNVESKSTTLYGDVNCDGKVNNDDVDYLFKHVSDYSDYELSKQGRINADVYKDGVISNRDVTALTKHLNNTEGYKTLPYIPKESNGQNNSTTLYGDVNCDGIINEKDTEYLRKYIAGYSQETLESTVELSEQGRKNADVYNDNEINLKDVLVLNKYFAKQEGYEKLPYIPEESTSSSKLQYKEELILKNYKEDTKKLVLEIYNTNGKKIVDLEIDLEKKEINVIGTAEEVTKISEEELKQYLGAFAMLNYSGKEYSINMTENEKKTISAILIAENKVTNVDVGLYSKNGTEVKRVLDKEKVHAFIESFTDLELDENGVMDFTNSNIFKTLTFKEKTQYLYELDSIGYSPTVMEVTSIDFIGGIYNVTFKFCYSTEEDKGFGENRIEDLPVYEMSMGLILDEDNEYSKYRISTMTEARLVKKENENTVQDTIEDNTENVIEEKEKNTIQGFLNIISSHEGSSTGMLQIEEIALIKDNEEWNKINNNNERDSEGYIKTHLKYSTLKNKMLEYMTEEMFKKYSYSYKNVEDVLWVRDTGGSGYTHKVESVKAIASSENITTYEVAYSTELFNGTVQKENVNFELQKNQNGKYVVSAWGWQLKERETKKLQIGSYIKNSKEEFPGVVTLKEDNKCTIYYGSTTGDSFSGNYKIEGTTLICELTKLSGEYIKDLEINIKYYFDIVDAENIEFRTFIGNVGKYYCTLPDENREPQGEYDFKNEWHFSKGEKFKIEK